MPANLVTARVHVKLPVKNVKVVDANKSVKVDHAKSHVNFILASPARLTVSLDQYA